MIYGKAKEEIVNNVKEAYVILERPTSVILSALHLHENGAQST